MGKLCLEYKVPNNLQRGNNRKCKFTTVAARSVLMYLTVVFIICHLTEVAATAYKIFRQFSFSLENLSLNLNKGSNLSQGENKHSTSSFR